MFAFNRTTNVPQTGDALNITAKIAKDWAAAAATNDVNPTEVEDGYYLFDLTQAETNAKVLDLLPESSTADIQVVGVPGTIYTVTPNFSDLGVEADGDLTKVNTLDLHTAQTGDSFARIGATGSGLTTLAQASIATEARLSELDTSAGKLVQDVIDILADVTGIAGAAMRGTDSAFLALSAPTNFSALGIEVGGALSTLNGHTAQTGDSFARIGAAGVSLTNISLPATGLDSILKTSLFAVAMASAAWDRILSGVTHNIPNSAGRRLRQLDAAFEVHSGTAQAGTVNTIQLDTGASAVNNIYNGDRIVIFEGTGAQEHGIVIAYDGTTKIATMSKNWVVTPDATSVFGIVPADVDVETWNGVAVTSSAGGLPDVNVNEIEDADATDQIRDAVVSDATKFAGANIALIKTEADKIALVDAGAGVVGSLIEEIENRSTFDVATDLVQLAANAITSAKIDATAADEIADALLDRAAGIETSTTPRQALRLILSAVVAKLSGAATTTVLIRDLPDTKNRITATVDASGNRTAITTDAT